MTPASALDTAHNALRGLLAPLHEVARLVPDGASVLELGCGQGLVLEALAARAGRLSGIDYDPRKCRMARELLGDRAQIHEGDLVAHLEDLAPGAFDCLVLSDTLSSFPLDQQDRILELAVSRLGPGGRLVLSFVDDDAGFKRTLAYTLSRITYGLRVSRSHGQRFTYRSADELQARLARLGCHVDRYALHRFPPRPIPHVALVAVRPAAVPAPAGVTFAVLNLRLGGQVSGLVSLADGLAARGLDVRWALPDGAASPAKVDVDAFAALPFPTRLARTWALLRSLRPRHDRDVLHLVLPSPAFAALAGTLRWPEDRVVVQYEGPSTQLDPELAAAFAADPALLAPRLVLNNAAWAPIARALRVTHLAPHPAIQQQLERLGFDRVHLLENLGDASGGEASIPPLAPLARANGETWIAYVGHAHPVKGVDLLVDAFERAATSRADLRLLLALTRDGRADVLQRRAATSAVADRIRVEGLVRVADVLAQVDALALPYRTALTTTLYPSLLLEADAARCPVVVSRLPELAPVLAWDSPSLQVVTPGDVESLATALGAVRRRVDETWSPVVILAPPGERLARAVSIYESLVR